MADTNTAATAADAARFLKLLDPTVTKFEFRTFDDDKDREDDNLTRTFYGTLAQHAAELQRFNHKGAGVFVTINETDGISRKAENIVRVRAVFVDLDGAPLAPVMAAKLKPHIVNETSPGRWHCYWLIHDMPLEDFTPVQRALIDRFKSCPNVHDLPRIMRLPGFFHQKQQPFRSRIVSTHEGSPYPAANFQRAKDEPRQPREESDTPPDIDKTKAALKIVPAEEYRIWWRVSGLLHNEFGEEGFPLFDDWSKSCPAKYNEHKVKRKWRDCRKITDIWIGTLYRFANEVQPGWSEEYDKKALEEALEAIREAAKLDREAAATTNPPGGSATMDDNDDIADAGDSKSQTDDSTTQKNNDNEAKEKPKSPSQIKATPFAWVDPTKVPLREWLYRPHYIRQFVSLTVSTGGVGKSSLLIAEALAMVSGKDLLNVSTDGELLRGWYWNGEDPADELQRRFAAAIKHFGLSPDDIGDRLFLDSGRNMPIVLAEEGKRGTVIATPVIKDVTATLLANKIDVLMIDPFVACHRVSENDNTAIERVAKAWSYIAEVANCSIMLAHHTRKTLGGNNVSVDDSRGASALLAAARTARTLNNMTKEEAEKVSINLSQRPFHFRSDIGKANLTRPAENADWFKLVSIDLQNNPAMPGMPGDEVGVVTLFEYPTMDERVVTVADIERTQNAIKTGGPWRRNLRAKQAWVGAAIAQVLGLDLALKENRQAVETRIQTWLLRGLLAIEKRPDPTVKNREPVDFVVVGRPPTAADAEEVF